ncbi:amino acid permease [Mycolicibacterium parafortuitum]|uniref:Amino acid permease-associated protein [Tsukamurella paurometabola DSM] n=1 Tax=Mycolicibacterium parafortuitum TaxID=39692 RepID=A0A375YN24_MYCPF|nr:amino acid permease [Mycolicibacterium parafortuitum]ORB28577.1 GABA permease [Mycolicibacterium parafortuitum]SRX82449.1 amino acid permease-associated protein [Tsukamurella paurometabola DSM] [Mycolicibacterium parafortuitum]
METSGQLGTSLKPRHITMISIAGIIGAGLFVGSANAIAEAGPAVILSYLMAGTLVVLVMRMLGEMAVANPDTGSFSVYADRALGGWAGFSIGWLYWWFWVLVIPVEATAAAEILSHLIGGAQWFWALAVTLLLTATNLISVGNYGEFEFWFALIKVVAIVAFIGIGVAAILGVIPDSEVSGLHQLWEPDGFMPNGFGAVVAAMLITMFSFMGTEIVTIAAAESPDPESGISRAVNSVIWRISLFYVGSIFVIVALMPYDRLEDGSYQSTLQAIGIPGSKLIMDLVILTAVASCLNSALYTASRMLFSLAERRDAPQAVKKLTGNGVPWVAVLASMVVGFLAVLGNYLLPDKIFGYLLATSGAVALFVYLVIAASQFVLGRSMREAGEKPSVRMWLFPYLTVAVIAAIVVVLVLMAFDPDQQQAIALSVVSAVFIVGTGVVVHRRHAAREAAELLSQA